MSIKNILFDLGGVLINIDYNRPVEAFGQLGYTHFENMYSQFSASPLFLDLEKGQVSPARFFEELRKLGPGHHNDQVLEQAWNSILLDFREPSLETVKKLSGQYRVFLLSNTNAIHHRAFSDIYERRAGGGKLDDLFEKAWYSHLIGTRKPDQAAFQYVLNDAGIRADETLFIDDTSENTESASDMGFHTWLLGKEERIENADGRYWTI